LNAKKVSEEYHKAKAEGTNPELVKVVESLIKKSKTKQNENKISQEASSQESGGKISEKSDNAENADEKGNVLAETGAEPEAAAPLIGSTEEAPMSGITHAQTEEARREFGLEGSYEKVPVTDKELEAQADKEIKKGYDIEKLISKLEKLIDPTPLETVILKKYNASLEAEIQKNPTDEKLSELSRLVQATDKIGSEQGRKFRLRQGMELRDDSLAGFFIDSINANLQAPLTDQQKEEVIKDHAAITDTQAKYDAKFRH
jgi:hypothetical protein